MFRKDPHVVVLDAWKSGSGDLYSLLHPDTEDFSDGPLNGLYVESAKAAEALNAAFSYMLETYPQRRIDLFELTSLLQLVRGMRARRRVFKGALPTLLSIFDRLDPDENIWNEPELSTDEVILFVLQTFAVLEYEPGIERITTFLKGRIFSESWSWHHVFRELKANPPSAAGVVRSLEGILPEHYCGGCYLDFVNILCREGAIENHPYDTQPGCERLHSYLTTPDEFGFSVTACAAIPFISGPPGAELLSVARRHSDPTVRMELAWATAMMGDDSGLQALAEFARDPAVSWHAVHYLQELDAHHWIPSIVDDDEFAALSEMAEWLSHGMEYGKSPSSVEIFDRRRLFWPPLNEEIDAFLVHYRFDHGDSSDQGVGMVGSTTFALGDTADGQKLSAEDIYASHCRWEMRHCVGEDDSSELTLAQAKLLLAEKNPGGFN